MKKIPVKNLKTNQIYSDILWLDEHFLLLNANIPIPKSLIVNLKSWYLKEIFTHGSEIDPNTPEASITSISNMEINDDQEEKQEREKAKQYYRELVAFTLDVYKKINEYSPIETEVIQDKIKELIVFIKENKPFMLRFPDLYIKMPEYFINNAARTTIIALAVAETLRVPHFRQIEIGISALMHEIGLMKIPPQIHNKATPLTDFEKRLVATYPVQGQKMIQIWSRSRQNPLVAEIITSISQLHEKEDGSGFPLGINGESINQLAKVVSVCRTYNYYITPPPYGKGLDGYNSMIMMIRAMKKSFNEKVVSALLRTLTLYPLGSYLRLTNKSLGIVIKTDPTNPKTQTVKLILDSHNHKYKESPKVKIKPDGDTAVIAVLNRQEIKGLIDRKLIVD